jgi:excisionase family DNA binding protein
MNDLPVKAPAKGRLLRWDQVAERLNISRAKVYRLIAQGHFVALNVGRSVRITEASLDDFIDRQIYTFALNNGESVSGVS